MPATSGRLPRAAQNIYSTGVEPIMKVEEGWLRRRDTCGGGIPAEKGSVREKLDSGGELPAKESYDSSC